MPFCLQTEKCRPIEPFWKFGFDVVSWHEERSGELVGLTFGDLVAYLSADAMQDQVA